MKRIRTTRIAGYTLPEIMIAVSIFTVVMTVALSAFSMAGRRIRAGTQQAILTNTARLAQQRIARMIEQGRTIALEDGDLAITQIDFTTAAIRFEPGPNHPDSLRNSVLVYYPNINQTNQRVVIANHVRAIGTNELFQILPFSPISAQLTFHVGLGPDDRAQRAGPALSGVDIRMSSTPRNRQRWYD